MRSEIRIIDANALLKNRFNMYTGFQGTVPVVAVRDIDDAPTIDPESLRPKGRWVMKETMIRSPFAKNAYCSECLEEASYAHNFCPNCGAKMEG